MLAAAIEDFGQKIDGARKDGRHTLRDALRVDLPADPREITLAEHLPAPDAKALLDADMEPRRVAALCALRDFIPKKPAGDPELMEWGRTVAAVRALTARLLDVESPLPIEEFNKAISMLPRLREAVERYDSLGYPAYLKAKRRQNGGPHFKIFQDTGSGEFFVGRNSSRGVVRLQSGFQSLKAAHDWLAGNTMELVLRWKSLRREQSAEANEPRTGPARREGDVRPEMFTGAFGFRGVQFGKSVQETRRQLDLNNSFDAFMDLSEALGITPMAVSLDGSLALAFGARGCGGKNAAAAHYETDRVVINLTRKNGPGSLAHEWFHALDNYFARLERTGSTVPKAVDDYASGLSEPPENIRPEVMAAFREIHRALVQGPYATRCTALDAEREASYHGLTIEKAARAFEIFLIGRLAAGGIANPFLTKPRKECLDAYPLPEEMTGGIQQAFENLFAVLETKETPNGTMLFTKPRRKML